MWSLLWGEYEFIDNLKFKSTLSYDYQINKSRNWYDPRTSNGDDYNGLEEGEGYDVDFDHQFIEAEKYDAKPTYKKFLGYRPGVAVIGDLIVGIENSDGNTNVRFHQKDTLKRFFERLEQYRLIINRFRVDCGSCSEEIVEEIAKHCKTFYIRANRCGSLYNDIFALRGWKKVELGGNLTFFSSFPHLINQNQPIK